MRSTIRSYGTSKLHSCQRRNEGKSSRLNWSAGWRADWSRKKMTDPLLPRRHLSYVTSFRGIPHTPPLRHRCGEHEEGTEGSLGKSRHHHPPPSVSPTPLRPVLRARALPGCCGDVASPCSLARALPPCFPPTHTQPPSCRSRSSSLRLPPIAQSAANMAAAARRLYYAAVAALTTRRNGHR